MNTTEERELEQNEKEEITRMIGEAAAIYDFMEKNDLYKRWMGDSERFMGFSFIHTKNLVKYSITLSKLTRWLIGLTIASVSLAVVNINLFFI